MGKNDRFQIIYTQGSRISPVSCWTPGRGVLYLQTVSGYAGGLTPLLDSEGRPMKWLPEEGEA